MMFKAVMPAVERVQTLLYVIQSRMLIALSLKGSLARRADVNVGCFQYRSSYFMGASERASGYGRLLYRKLLDDIRSAQLLQDQGGLESAHQ